MRSPARRFTLVMFAASILFVGGPVLLNYLVDPYDRFGNNRLGIYISAERESKASEVTRYPHTALMVGNSRMALIPASSLKGFRFFNGAFSAASAEEIYWYVHHFAYGQQLVVLGIDYGAKNPATLRGDIFRRGDWAAVAENLVSLQTLEYSLKTIFSHWSGIPSRFAPDGSFTQVPIKPEKPGDAAIGRVFLENLKSLVGGFVAPKPGELSLYRKIADTLRERKIPCVVVMPPMHEAAFRQIEAMNLQGAYQTWLDEMKTIFPHVVNLTLSPYSAASNFYALDPVHYKPEVGAQFMNEEVLPVAMKALRDYGQ